MFGSPEQNLLQKKTPKFSTKTKEERILFQKLVIDKAGDRPMLSDFADIFDKEEIARDARHLSKFIGSKGEDTTDESELLEAITREHIEMSEWLGPECFTSQTSRYDDVNGSGDLIVEFPGKDGTPIRLALDTTFYKEKEDNRHIDEKLLKIKDRLNSGRGVNIKYFQSNLNDFRGKIYNLPKIIIAMKTDTLARLSELINEGFYSGEIDQEQKKILRNKLSNGNLKTSLVQTIMHQLQKQKEYLENHGKNNSEIYRNILPLLEYTKKLGGKIKKSPTINEDNGKALAFEELVLG